MMDEFSALAQRISVSVREVRGCLVLSRDGLVLGAYPDDDEGLARSAWLRFAALGEPERSFVAFPELIWGYVRRGGFAGFVVAEAGVRPGVLLDQIEQILFEAEAARAKREGVRPPDSAAAPSGRPRTSLHPQPSGMASADAPPAMREQAGEVPQREAQEVRSSPGPWKRFAQVEERAEAAAATPERGTARADRFVEKPGGHEHARSEEGKEDRKKKKEKAKERPPAPGEEESAQGREPEVDEAPAQEPPTSMHRQPRRLVSSPHEGEGDNEDEGEEIDRFLLAKEFAGLLQMGDDEDEVSS
jgi:hypothetical protein